MVEVDVIAAAPESAAPVRTTAGEPLSFGERPCLESPVAYELLLPKTATAIASIRVAGDPILSRPRRDDATMVWCRLTGEDTSLVGIDPSEGITETSSDGHALPFAPASLDCVILHGTLDRWRDANALLNAVRIALKPGGVVALTVANRFDPAHFRRHFGSAGGGNDVPPTGRRRTLWGYRRLLRRSGLSPTASFFVLQDPGAAATRIISTRRAPSTTFFGHQNASLTAAR